MPEEKRVRRTPQQIAQDLDEQMEKLNASIAEPVSYTHLDVYKRQQLDSTVLVEPDGTRRPLKK